MSLLTYLTGITALTPIKIAWVALTLLNVGMMLALAWRKSSGYFAISAACSLLQGSVWWGAHGEAFWVGSASVFVWKMLPKNRYGRIFALSIGLLITCVLMLAVPPPWAGYDPAMYYTRLYSTAAFLGVSFGAALLTRDPATMLAVPWFGAVMLASSQRGWDRWVVGIFTNATWTLCLICWLAISRRAHLEASSGLDAPGEHPRSARYLPWMGISSLPRQQRGIRR